jgi:hypothetical protein
MLGRGTIKRSTAMSNKSNATIATTRKAERKEPGQVSDTSLRGDMYSHGLGATSRSGPEVGATGPTILLVEIKLASALAR